MVGNLGGLLAVHVKPICADEMLLIKHRVVRTQEVKILELKNMQV